MSLHFGNYLILLRERYTLPADEYSIYMHIMHYLQSHNITNKANPTIDRCESHIGGTNWLVHGWIILLLNIILKINSFYIICCLSLFWKTLEYSYCVFVKKSVHYYLWICELTKRNWHVTFTTYHFYGCSSKAWFSKCSIRFDLFYLL